MLRCFWMNFWSIFHRFLVPTSTPRTFKNLHFPLEKWGFFKKSPFEDNIVLGSILKANLPQFWVPKSIKILQKSEPKRHWKIDQFWLRSLIDFWSILAPSWKPRWTQVEPKTEQKRMRKNIKQMKHVWRPSWIPKKRIHKAKRRPKGPKWSKMVRMQWCLGYIYGYHSPPLEPPYFIFLLLSEQASLQVIKRHFGRTSLVSRHICIKITIKINTTSGFLW